MIKLSVNVNKVATDPQLPRRIGAIGDRGSRRGHRRRRAWHHRSSACRRPAHHVSRRRRSWPTCWRLCAGASSSTSKATRAPICWRWCVASAPTSARWCPSRRARSPVRRGGRPPRRSTSSARWSRDLQAHGVRVSLFVDAEPAAIEWAAEMGGDRVELYTEPFAQSLRARGAGGDRQSSPLRDAARRAHDRAWASTRATISTWTTWRCSARLPISRRCPSVTRSSAARCLSDSRAPCASISRCCRGTRRETSPGGGRRPRVGRVRWRRPDRGRRDHRASRVGRHSLVGRVACAGAHRASGGAGAHAHPHATPSGISTAEALNVSGFGVLALDLRGHGASAGSSSALATHAAGCPGGVDWLKTRPDVVVQPARHRRRVAWRRRWRRWWPPSIPRCARLRCCRRPASTGASGASLRCADLPSEPAPMMLVASTGDPYALRTAHHFEAMGTGPRDLRDRRRHQRPRHGAACHPAGPGHQPGGLVSKVAAMIVVPV